MKLIRFILVFLILGLFLNIKVVEAISWQDDFKLNYLFQRELLIEDEVNLIIAHGQEFHQSPEEKIKEEQEENKEAENREIKEQEEGDTDSPVEDKVQDYGYKLKKDYRLKRSRIITMGVVSYLLFLLNGILYYLWKRSNSLKERRKHYFRRVLNYHCIVGIIGLLIVIFFHIVPQFHGLFLSPGWIMLFLYSLVILLGILKKYFKVKLDYKLFRVLHVIVSVIAILITVYHVLDKLYII
ncbi:hypothetical protein BX659_11519 [Orenia metallireducens]|uniref:Uncharacterized protein n=1 Tax=Orenia metallireducens TaxID=1413210 RepID=A0A285HFF8_9FIRM|nr:hypothetical protein [Orenia metallireducens]PRX27693.1 hypothetical protein BX659_11519 [Orenia metallireducens]SNY33451.1 hypothetical protein SAMN06265827_11719 [Orenia metallireducens]